MSVANKTNTVGLEGLVAEKPRTVEHGAVTSAGLVAGSVANDQRTPANDAAAQSSRILERRVARRERRAIRAL